jgi:predicted ATPase
MISIISIKNLKSLRAIDLDVCPLNILAGINGVGKTAFIQALLLLRQSYEQKLLPSKGLSLIGDYVHIGRVIDAYSENASREEGLSIELEFHNNQFANFRFEFNAEQRDENIMPLNQNSEFSDEIFQTNLFSNNFNYLTAERIGPRIIYSLSPSRVLDKRQLGMQGEFAPHFLSEFGESLLLPIKELRHPDAKNDRLIEQVNAWLNEISPGASVETKTVDRIREYAELKYKFKVGDTGFTNEYSPLNVGFSFSYNLSILVAILSAEPGGILFMENPESHLHPKGQSIIGRLLSIAAEHGVQIFVETHSDHIINGVRVAVKHGNIGAHHVGIFFFERKGLFKITQQTVECLKQKRVPSEIIEALLPLTGKKFIEKNQFLRALRGNIGKQRFAKYEDMIVEYAKMEKMYSEHATDAVQLKVDNKGIMNKYPDGFIDEWDNMLDELITE